MVGLWSLPAEYSETAINQFLRSFSTAQTDCFYEYDLTDGLVFTNKGYDIGDYNDDEVCIYRIKNIG